MAMRARHAEREGGLMKLKLQSAVELALAGADRLMRRSLRYGALPKVFISCLERHLYYCLPLTVISYLKIYSDILVAESHLHQHLLLLSCPVADPRPAVRASQQHPADSTRKHLQPQQAIDGYVQRISFLSTSSAEPRLVTTKPKHVF